MSGITDALRAAGFMPEESKDGEWEPYKGTYKVQCTVLRPETADDGSEFIQSEYKVMETLAGDQIRDSKFADFRKRYYLSGEKAEQNLKNLINDFFTMGIQLDYSSDEALKASLPNAIGAEGYLRGWAWTPEGKGPQQSFVIQKAKVALKRKDSTVAPF